MKRAIAEEQPAAARRSVARRSCTKARNGATPVPGPTMMMSLSGAGSAKCRFGLSQPHVTAALETLGHVVRGHTLAGAAMGFVAHRGNQQMRLVAHLTARGRDRVGARRQGARQRAQRLGVERDRERSRSDR